jgi:glutaredoxin 3
MANITIYTTLLCPYCHRAKALLRKKGASFTEIDVGMDPAKRADMTARANGRHSVPQIFIDGVHVGGSDDIHALDAEGKLDPMLAAEHAPA